MSCAQCCGIEAWFKGKRVARELKRYRTRGPDKTTRMLIDALKAEGVEGMTLLDVGGGFGAVSHSLVGAGVRAATNVDASTDYIQAANDEAERQGYTNRVSHRHGDFIDLAREIEPADVVTLDRVICCYHDMKSLVGLSTARARSLIGLVYPRDNPLTEFGSRVINFGLWLQRNSFRVFIHPSEEVDRVIGRAGFARRFYRRTPFWQVVVYRRASE